MESKYECKNVVWSHWACGMTYAGKSKYSKIYLDSENKYICYLWDGTFQIFSAGDYNLETLKSATNN